MNRRVSRLVVTVRGFISDMLDSFDPRSNVQLINAGNFSINALVKRQRASIKVHESADPDLLEIEYCHTYQLMIGTFSQYNLL